MKRVSRPGIVLPLMLLFASLLVLPGCGGGDGGVTTVPESDAGGIVSISGTAVKGPVNGGTVTAYAVNNGAMGARLASASTDPQGNFTMSFCRPPGPVVLSMSGGSYTDEATGSTMTMAANDVMTAVLPSISSGAVTGIQITPVTSMAQAMAGNMAGGMTTANVTTANMAMGNYFMVKDILTTPPMNPSIAGAGAGASQDMRNYGVAIAGMMQYAKQLGMPSSSGMVTAMMNDATDGVMNGMMTGGKPVAMGGGMSMMGGGTMMQGNAGTSGLANAMSVFMSSGMNRSGLTAADMQALMNQLSSSSGAIR
ncbi:MAG: hypothetical protein M1539_00690 [Actinobacteria bacterium]|nr:hypothetical protein [Actinomycetota bacterium]